MISRLTIGVGLAAFAMLDVSATTYYVNNAPGGGCSDLGPGTSNVPFCRIQAGYDRAADGDEVLVAPGTYPECLFLGFRAIRKNVSVVASAWRGNPPDNTVTIIDGTRAGACTFPNTAPASLVNISGSGATGSTFQGFTVRGAVDSGLFGVGSVTITNNVVRDNSVRSYGGGIYIYSANCYYGATSTTIAGNLMQGNRADIGGGGIQVTVGREDIVSGPECSEDGDATLTIRDNVITGNRALGGGGGVHATIFNNDAFASRVVITNNTITGNVTGSVTVYGYGGGIYGLTYGHGSETLEVVGNTVSGNTAEDLGGGVSVAVSPYAHATSATNHLVLVENNRVTGNTGKRGGGGIDLYALADSLTSSEALRLQSRGNTVTSNRVTFPTLPVPPNFNGGGGVSAQLYAIRSISPNLEMTLQRDLILDNSSTFYGGGVSVRSVADGEGYYGGLAPARAEVGLVGNLIAGNQVTASPTLPTGGAAFVYLEALGEATATVDLRLNTLAGNTLGTTAASSYVEPASAAESPARIGARRRPDGVSAARSTATYHSAGLHVESFTLWDSHGQHEGAAALRVNSTIVATNGGVGIGGPVPGTAGTQTPGGTANVTLDVLHSDVFGNSGGGYEAWVGDRTGVEGNIAQDPSFVDPAADDFHLAPGSPAIDAGDPALPPPVPPTDADGDARVLDGDGDGVAVVDMGYDEAVSRSRVVAIDIKPGSQENPLNPWSRGVVPVAVLGGADFDVTSLEVATLRFGPQEAPPAHDLRDPATYAEHLQDVDLDGDLDLVVHFRTSATGIACGDTEATLIGETTLGVSVRGTDSIATTGCRAGDRGGPWSREERFTRPAAGGVVDIDRY